MTDAPTTARKTMHEAAERLGRARLAILATQSMQAGPNAERAYADAKVEFALALKARDAAVEAVVAMGDPA